MPITDVRSDLGALSLTVTGEVVEVRPWHRMVTTERMLGSDGPGALNGLILTTVEGGTVIVTVITSRPVKCGMPCWCAWGRRSDTTLGRLASTVIATLTSPRTRSEVGS